MRSEIHAAVPLWINTPLEPPLPSGSPVTERWRLVQKHLPPLAELLGVEIVIMNAEGYCVGGTGPYLRGVGFRMPADNALTYSLRSGQSSMVLTPGKEEVCRTCSGKGACADVANFTGPVVIENEIVAVVQIVAFTDNQRAELLMKSEKAFELISQIIGFAWARGRDVESLPEQPRDDRFPSIIGESKAILRLKAAILKAAGTNATVLIQGESGTGKELIAQAVHDNSPRHTGPFVAINCGAIPESLMESELLGYEPGAFTGGKKNGSPGMFEFAHGGTLFLDEIGEMPLELQSKLLRVIQEKEVRRIGASRVIPVDVRIIAATNKDLNGEVAANRFRADLYYRLNILHLHLPPLRAYTESAGEIAEKILRKLAPGSEPDRAAPLRALLAKTGQYRWPGNLRELENIVRRYLALSPYLSRSIKLSDIFEPSELAEGPRESGGWENSGELQKILSTYYRMGCSKTLTAQELGISRSTLWRKLRQIRNPDS